MRVARTTTPHAVHHVISRFIDKEWLVSSDQERERYLQLLGKALDHTDWRCIAYAIMSSHIHLAMVAGEHEAESWSRRVNPPFANWINEKHCRIGPLFASRAGMWITRVERVADLLAYIHNNPVRGHVCSHPSESTWTSHGAYTGQAATPPWLGVDEGLVLAGVARTDFDHWVDARSHIRWDDPSLGAIARAAKRRGALELGTPTREPLEAPLVARAFAHVRPDPARVVEIVSEVSGLGLGEIRSRSRDAVHVGARAVAIQTGKCFGLPMSSTGAALGISAQAAARLGSRYLDELRSATLSIARERVGAELATLLRKEKASPLK